MNPVKAVRWGVLGVVLLSLVGVAFAAARPFMGRAVTLGVFAGGSRGAISYFRSATSASRGSSARGPS
ncbi:MAG: hypothetical protein N0A24_04440 [Armatimonadetes bacterium]|nr:hypothetical protein [Armatimonadota bacterium]MDW8153459.1 hypothetical protein [Armatimonadota bacterium]